MRPSLDERRAVVSAAAEGLRQAWETLDKRRRRHMELLAGSWWLWRLFVGRDWTRAMRQHRSNVRAALAEYRAVCVDRDREHAWMVLNQQADRFLANWIRAKHGKGFYTPPRPPPSEVELAWAAYMVPDEHGNRGERPIPREEPRPAEREHAPGAPSPAALILDGEVRGVTRDEHGRLVAVHMTPDGFLRRSLITDAQARALAERIAAAEAADLEAE